MTAKRTDSNQVEVVKLFRELGCSVWVTSECGKGAPDIVIGFENERGHRVSVLVEIKDGKKPPSQRRLTPDEVKFHDGWRGLIAVVETPEDVIALVNRLR